MTRRLLPAVFFFILFQSCHVARFFIYNFADARDYKKFPKKELKRSEHPFYFTEVSNTHFLKLPKTITRRGRTFNFEKALKKTGTIAFIIIRNDSMLYQWYRPGYDKSSVTTSFSMSKSYVSALIGIAIDEGFIKSTSEPITNYIDYLDKTTFGKITIQHLLDMQSGIQFNENYFNPGSDIAKYYYGTHIKKYLKHLSVSKEPGKFRYMSLNSQILGLIIEKATGRSLTAYLQEKIWSPLGMEYDASWSIDSKKNQTEKAFCCINARAIDFAKFGRLYLNKGNWNGKQIISRKWVDESVNFKEPKNFFFYSNQWWHTRSFISINDTARSHVQNFFTLSDTANMKRPFLITENKKKPGWSIVIQPSGDFYAQGLLGQYIYVYPKKNMIIVRLGKREGGIFWARLFKDMAEMN